MRRRKLLAVLAGMAVVLAAGAFVLWPRPSRITPENFDRIRQGMPRAELEAILGPPGDFSSGPMALRAGFGSLGHEFLGDDALKSVWKNDTAIFIVLFDDSDTVADAVNIPIRRSEQTPLENLVWRTKRLLHRWFR